jgi:cysteinyl-tRNA synthetase
MEAMLASYRRAFADAMDDDLNTALAVSVLFDLARSINGSVTQNDTTGTLTAALTVLKELGGVLGLLCRTRGGGLDGEVEALIQQRTLARNEKNFVLADEIRDKLKARGIILEDTPSGVKWRKE